MAKKSTSSIFQTTFSRIGNLAFYNGWSPNYVYFKSLRNANEQYVTKRGSSTWNPAIAGPIAQQAIADAESHDHLPNMTQEDSNEHFLQKFQEIINFLKQAEDWERKNETRFFSQKLQNLNDIFKNVQSKTILKSLMQVKKKLQDGTTQFDYDNFITLINVLMTDIQTAKINAEYESKRITEVQNILLNLIESRRSQVKGLHEKKHINNTSRAMDNAEERLKRKITIEYAEHAQLTRKEKVQVKNRKTGKLEEKEKYVLFGGAQFQNKIKPAISQALAHWANNVIAEITKNPETINEIVKQIEKDYDTSGNFYALTQPIRETIILAVLQYGMNNLNTVLNKELNETVINSLTDTLKLNDNEIFDTVMQYDIHGANNSFGLKGQELDMFHDITADTLEKSTNSAREITNAVQKFINTAETEMNEEQKTLLSALRESKHEDRVRQLITLVNEIESLQEERDKALKEWQDQTKKIDLDKKVTLSTDSTIPITISVHKGKVTINMEEFKRAINDNDTFTSMMFKQFNPTTLTTALATVKGRASQELKTILKTSATNAIKNGLDGLSKEDIIGTMRQALEQLEVKVKGPSLAEFMAGVQFRAQGSHLFIDWTGGINGKNDNVIIEIKHNKLVQQIKTEFAGKVTNYMINSITKQELKIEELQTKLLSDYQKTIDEHVQKLTRTNDMQKYSKMLSDTRMNFETIIQQDEELSKTYAELKTMVNKFMHSLDHIGVEEGKVEQIASDYLNVLKNSFHISTTVKSYNTYTNALGFTGGSLGNNLDAQLSRIADIFESAGMPINEEDFRWLRSAIINCFPGSIVGEKNKTLIENYLGALAAFALFDEGGAETTIISDFYHEYFSQLNNETNADILHLYIVDGIYVPGSFVIQKTRETLEKEVIPNIQKIPQIMYRGAGVMIINQASEKDIPNRPISKHIANANTWAWSLTGSNVASQVSIKILFLAGLLDIVNTINSKLSSVEIPA